jgi:branched-chain amino acid transport system substrate-binding protein
VLLSVLLLVLAACGGGSGSQDSGSGPIVLGQIASLTGNYTPLGTNDQKGAAQAVEEINAAGGVLGRQLQIVVRDDKTQPDQAVIAFNDLAGQNVAAVIGSPFSNSTWRSSRSRNATRSLTSRPQRRTSRSSRCASTRS